MYTSIPRRNKYKRVAIDRITLIAWFLGEDAFVKELREYARYSDDARKMDGSTTTAMTTHLASLLSLFLALHRMDRK